MLLEPRVAGLRGHNGTLYESDYIEPIVSREQWEAVKAILTDPARRTSNNGTPGTSARGGVARYLLTGLIWCGKCGARARGTRARGTRHRGQVGYECNDASHGGNR